jgi:hypothetical protein
MWIIEIVEWFTDGVSALQALSQNSGSTLGYGLWSRPAGDADPSVVDLGSNSAAAAAA